MIITVTNARQRKMILWESAPSRLTAITHSQASASGSTVINTSYCPELDDQQGSAAPDMPGHHDRLPDSGWAVFARPVARSR